MRGLEAAPLAGGRTARCSDRLRRGPSTRGSRWRRSPRASPGCRTALGPPALRPLLPVLSRHPHGPARSRSLVAPHGASGAALRVRVRRLRRRPRTLAQPGGASV